MNASKLLAALLLCSAGLVAATTAAAAATPLTGEVLEAREADPYVYLRLKTADGETWAAVNKIAIKPGAKVTIDNPLVMRDFESKALKKTFATIVFGAVADPNAPSRPTAAPMFRPDAGKHGATPVAATPVKVAKASGADARTVAEVVLGKDKLKDKPVTVRAQVVKVTSGVMGKNWLHVQDGSGSPGDRTNDILVTSKAAVAVGDVVSVKGTVRTEVKLGSGYNYPVLIEDASVTK